MALQTKLRRRFQISESEDAPGMLMLFSVLLSAAREAEMLTGREFEIRHGTILTWGNILAPSLAELQACASSGNIPDQYRQFVVASQAELRDGAFGSTLRLALQHARVFGVSKPNEICRVLAAVAQTELTQVGSLRAHNLRLASKYHAIALQKLQSAASAVTSLTDVLPSSSTVVTTIPSKERASLSGSARPKRAPIPVPTQPYADRSDERGCYLEDREMSVWYASYVGPEYANQIENQDSAYALLARDSQGIAFAIADGVSTSTGARFGAAAAAYLFCHKLQSGLGTTKQPSRDTVVGALQAAQSDMDDILVRLIENWAGHDFREVYGAMPRDSAALLLENTRVPKRKNWPPALASTLIGGYILQDRGSATGLVARIGDGVVEHVHTDRRVTNIFSMDSRITAISSFFGPGPICAEHLPRVAVEEIHIDRGDILLISSDGLMHGHTSTVYEMLISLLGEDSLNHLPRNDDAAISLLQHVSAEADSRYTARDGSLFADNLSLLLIREGMSNS